MNTPRILFVSPCGPYPKTALADDPYDFFYYRNTLHQRMFQMRSFQSWHSLHYLAQNIPIDSTVLENPPLARFKQEVARGNYQTVAMAFTVIATGRILDMVRWCKANHPDVQIIIGGYGTAVFKDPDDKARQLGALVDRICTGEGVAFMRAYCKERWGLESNLPLCQDFLPAVNYFFRSRVRLFKQLVFVSSLGCTGGCSFCATSAQFNRKKIPLASGRVLFELVLASARKHPDITSAIIYSEDFLSDRQETLEFMRQMEACQELHTRPLLLTVFSSVRSVSHYSIAELIRCGIGTLFIGVESFSENVLSCETLAKRTGDVEALFAKLHCHGINTLGSFIIGWDGQNPGNLKEEIDRFVALNPTFYQVIPLHPVPGTPLWDKIRGQKRFLDDFSFDKESVGGFSFTLANLATEAALNAVTGTYKSLVDEGGPWPFRVLENLLDGIRQLNNHADDLLRKRGQAYKKLIRPIVPLAIVSRLFFYGPGFRQRWQKAMGHVAKEYPRLFFLSTAAGVLLAPLLLGFYLLLKIRFRFTPQGDQPECVRLEYRNSVANR